jgi:hypothetical protein
MALKRISLDHVPPEVHEGIGLVANSWNHVEGAAERIVWLLARLDQNRGAAITTHMGIGPRLDAALTLARLEFPDAPATARLKELREPIRGPLYGKRNRIVHSRVLHLDTLGGGVSLRSEYKARGELKRSLEPATLDECKQASDEMLDSATALRDILAAYYRLIEEVDGEPPP